MTAPEAQTQNTGTPEGTPAQVDPEAANAKAETDWRAEAKKWEARAKENKSAADKLADLELANASELERAVAKAKSEGISEATTRANQRLVAAAARALAADAKFHQPKDAPKLLDLSGVKVNDDGEVDEDAIKALIDEAVKDRGYLVKSDEKPAATKTLRHNPSQGNAGDSTPSVQAGLDAYAARKAAKVRPGSTNTH